MKTLTIKVSEQDVKKYNLETENITFNDLVKIISREYARDALLECHRIALQTGLSSLTQEEIDAEVKGFRDAKNYH